METLILNQEKEVKLKAGGFLHRAKLKIENSKIYIKFGYNKALLTEIKSFDGARWHPAPDKFWSIKNSGRNRFQLLFLMGENPYIRYDQTIREFEYSRPLRTHQKYLSNCALTYHYCIWAAEMGTGKTLAAFEVMEHSSKAHYKKYSAKMTWWYIAPKSVLRAIEVEKWKWKLNLEFIDLKLMSYENLVKTISTWRTGDKAPVGIIFDESSRVKNPTAKRSQAAFHLAEANRSDWNEEGYIIEMSGSPAPKDPTNWWMQAEIACPGFLKEGNIHKFKNRLAIIKQETNLLTGGIFPKLVTWKDDENKCDICGKLESEHKVDVFETKVDNDSNHKFVKSKNEISYLYERMKGLVQVIFKKDVLKELPEKIFIPVNLEPSEQTLKLAKLVAAKSSRAIQTLTMLRELSDGFQYIKVPCGEGTCPKCNGVGKCIEYKCSEDDEPVTDQNGVLIGYREPGTNSTNIKSETFETICDNCGGKGLTTLYKTESQEIYTPKEDALIDDLDSMEDIGRIVVFAGFTGSIDRVNKICIKHNWKTIRIDGRGWLHPEIPENPLLAFQEKKKEYEKVAIVAHPESGGIGQTYTASPLAVFWSNDFKAENRIQAVDRIHRMGMDINLGATIKDYLHLKVDQYILDNLNRKRDLQAMTLGEMKKLIDNL